MNTPAPHELVSSRFFPHSRQRVFEAFSDPQQLTLWFGPNGFTSTFETFDFRIGGEWVFTFHGPNGTDYPNQSTFVEIVPNERIVYAIEDDTGAGVPLGFQVEAHTADGADDPNRATQVMSALAPWRDLLTPLGADTISLGHSGADVGPLLAHGTIGFGLEHDMSGYWRVHHTEADTLDKIDPMLVRRNAAALTVFTWLLAETPELFDGTRPLQAQP
jgi:uncharacterized protein YndB with AHSA1/START domain